MPFLRGDRAQSLVEFALVLPLVLLIITGLFDLARGVAGEHPRHAARQGTRYAIVHGAGSNLPLGPAASSEPNIARASCGARRSGSRTSP